MSNKTNKSRFFFSFSLIVSLKLRSVYLSIE